MTDRTRSTHTASAPRTRAATTTSAGVRRNLFQGQLTRRPTASSSNSAETLRLTDVDVDVLSDSEIVVRDKHGEIEIEEPPGLMLVDEDEIPVDDRQDHEKERQRLAEAVKNHQINHNSTAREEPGELLAALRGILKTHVAKLAEENWMFEPEDILRG